MKRFWQQLAIATNWPVLVAIFVLSALGVLSIYSDAPDEGAKQAVFLCIAAVGMAAVQMINYQRIGHFAWAFYLFSLVLVFYTDIGATLDRVYTK